METLIGDKTMREIDMRVPDALRLAFGIRYRATPPPAPGERDEIASFAAALLPPRARGDDDDGAVDDPMDCDDVAPPPGDLRMAFECRYLPDHNEDAHFGHAAAGVVGVADGVGGYRDRGVDASAFARGLMRSAHEEVAFAFPGARVCPLALLERAHRRTAAARTPAASTVVILSLAGRTLRWAYVGDSGFAVFRDGRLLRRSQPQQLFFNCPYQLNSEAGSATAAHAAVGEVTAKEGDVVVVGTDGLFDNVSDDELERMVRMGTALGFTPRNMAEVIAAFAYEAARCTDRDTPYSVSKRKEEGTAYAGGKPDDITVIVAFIVS
ncbi:hypothetical protein ACP70R_026598 [Stipagrostis hirtigluma subsp. patula]